MNDTQRFVYLMARECVIARVENPVITVPQCVLDLLDRKLSEGMLLTPKLSGERCASIRFAGVTFKVGAA